MMMIDILEVQVVRLSLGNIDRVELLRVETVACGVRRRRVWESLRVCVYVGFEIQTMEQGKLLRVASVERHRLTARRACI